MGNNQESGQRVLYSCMPIYSHENAEIFIVSDNKTLVRTEQPIVNDATNTDTDKKHSQNCINPSKLYHHLLSIF